MGTEGFRPIPNSPKPLGPWIVTTLFTVSTLALAAALRGNEFLMAQLGLTSAAALIPALIGMLLGQSLRRRLPESTFRHLFFIALFLLGAYIIVSAAMPIPLSPAPQ